MTTGNCKQNTILAQLYPTQLQNKVGLKGVIVAPK
jgi:hypothetical protein